jgi:hypothetical protein
MGYRSDVAYVIHFDTIEHRDNFITLMHAKNEEPTNTALSEVQYKYGAHPIITLHQEGWKWYDAYPEVQAHHALMRDAEGLFGAEWRFVRVGEDANDVETQSGGDGNYDLWEYVDPVTSISIDFPEPDAE